MVVWWYEQVCVGSVILGHWLPHPPNLRITRRASLFFFSSAHTHHSSTQSLQSQSLPQTTLHNNNMVQSLNPSAIWTLSTAVLRRPSLMIPDFQVATIAEVDWPALRDHHPVHQALVFDKDNTLTVPYANEIHGPLQASVQQAMEAFPGRVAVLSNSAGTASDDPGDVAAVAFEQANRAALGDTVLPVIRHTAKKPSRKCLQQVLAHFETDTPLKAENLVIIGDRLWTDIVFGNLYGCTTIYCAQVLDHASDHWTARRIRPLEQRVSRWWQRRLGRHVTAPPTKKNE